MVCPLIDHNQQPMKMHTEVNENHSHQDENRKKNTHHLKRSTGGTPVFFCKQQTFDC